MDWSVTLNNDLTCSPRVTEIFTTSYNSTDTREVLIVYWTDLTNVTVSSPLTGSVSFTTFSFLTSTQIGWNLPANTTAIITWTVSYTAAAFMEVIEDRSPTVNGQSVTVNSLNDHKLNWAPSESQYYVTASLIVTFNFSPPLTSSTSVQYSPLSGSATTGSISWPVQFSNYNYVAWFPRSTSETCPAENSTFLLDSSALQSLAAGIIAVIVIAAVICCLIPIIIIILCCCGVIGGGIACCAAAQNA